MWIYWLPRSLTYPEEDEDLVQCFKFTLLLSKPPRFTDQSPPQNAGAGLGCKTTAEPHPVWRTSPAQPEWAQSWREESWPQSHRVRFFYLTFLFKSINNLAPWYLIKLLPESSPPETGLPFPPPFSPSNLLAWLPCGLGPSATLTLRTS